MSDQRPYPRRCYEDLMSPAEMSIREAIMEVERCGAHVLLTDAIQLLQQAQNKVADFIDLNAVR